MTILTNDLVNPFTGEVLAEAGEEYPIIDENMQAQLAQDTINVALNIAGYDVGAMSQFEKASALLDMAQELCALS